MKKTSLYIVSLAIAATAFTACDNEFERPPMVVPTSTWQANTTIEELKAAYWSTVEGTPTTVGLTAEGDSLIIKGRVCSSDESGNIFKYLMIQGESEAIALTLDFYDIYSSYKYGQEVYINATGLTIGGYSGLMCLGNGTDDRGRVARAAEDIFAAHAQVNGLPNTAAIDTVTTTITAVEEAKTTAEGLALWQSQLVRFNNVSFEDAGKEFAPDGSANGAAERYIVDEAGKRIMVRNSTYSDFNTELLPCGQGSVVGILSYYGTAWQVLLIDREGCIGFNGVMPPVFTPTPGIVKEGTSVTIACATEDAEIHYTLDGTDPTASSTLYTEPIVINETTTIKAIATKVGHDASIVVSAKYIVSSDAPEEGDGTAAKPYNVAQAKAKAIENGSSSTENVYVKGYIISGSINLTYGSGTWTICDDPSGAGETFELYGTYNTDNGKFTDENAVKIGDLVVAVGPIYNYNDKTPEMSRGHLVSINGEGGETPDPTPAGGEIFSSLSENDAVMPEGWTIDNVNIGSLEAVWSWKTYNGKGYLNASAYSSAGNIDTEAYAVSPVIDLSAVTKANMTFDHAAKFQTTLKDLCGVCVRLEGASSWTALTIPTWPDAGAWTFVNSGEISLDAYAGKKIQIAFKYGSSSAGADTWEIKNLTVSSGN